MKHLKISVLIFTFFLTNNLFPQWTVQNSGTTQDLKSVYFINSNTGYVVGNTGTMLKTTNSGQNWQTLSSSVSVNLNAVFFINSNTGVVVGNTGTILKTTNSGLNWTNITSGVADNLYSLSFSSNNGIIGGSSLTILYSTNSGNNWSIAQTGFISPGFFGADMVNDSVGYVGGVNSIFGPLLGRTTNGGQNWNFTAFLINNTEGTLRDIDFINNDEGFAVSTVWPNIGGISHSTNGGQNWTSITLVNPLWGLDFPTDNIGYAVGNAGAISKTTNRGGSWSNLLSNTTNHLNDVNFIDSLMGFVVGVNGTILKTNSGGITSIIKISGNSPHKFQLSQNYPNPFNPVTTINFYIPYYTKVKLVIYDVNGKLVEKIIDKNFSTGSFSYTWNAFDKPSGIYFYKLVMDKENDTKETISLTKKMILLK